MSQSHSVYVLSVFALSRVATSHDPVIVAMSETEVPPKTGDNNRPQVPLPSVPLGDLLGTICEAVQAEVNFAIACLAAQEQPVPAPPMPPPSIPQTSPVTSGKCVFTLWGVVLADHIPFLPFPSPSPGW